MPPTPAPGQFSTSQAGNLGPQKAARAQAQSIIKRGVHRIRAVLGARRHTSESATIIAKAPPEIVEKERTWLEETHQSIALLQAQAERLAD